MISLSPITIIINDCFQTNNLFLEVSEQNAFEHNYFLALKGIWALNSVIHFFQYTVLSIFPIILCILLFSNLLLKSRFSYCNRIRVKGLKEKDRSREHPMDRLDLPAKRINDGARGNIVLTTDEVSFSPDGEEHGNKEC